MSDVYTLYSACPGIKVPESIKVWECYSMGSVLASCIAHFRGSSVKSVLLIQGRVVVELLDDTKFCFGTNKDVSIYLK